MDGNGSRSNDDACSKQFNRQRHEGYVAMLARLDYENLIQVNQAEVSEQVGMNRHNVKPFNQEADRAWRYPRGRQNRH